MKELAKGKLYSFDEKVRVEIGPQIINLDCTDENLSDKVTHRNYRIGTRDAYGKIIRYDEISTPELKKKISTSMGVVSKGEVMSCVDWDAKHVPHLWKVYQIQEVGKDDSRFIKVEEFEGKDEALAFAESLFREMK